jgi:hypothetical protein
LPSAEQLAIRGRWTVGVEGWTNVHDMILAAGGGFRGSKIKVQLQLQPQQRGTTGPDGEGITKFRWYHGWHRLHG